jgi:hypothetical protein
MTDQSGSGSDGFELDGPKIAFIAVVVAFFAGFITCLVMIHWPSKRSIDAREDAIARWDEANQQQMNILARQEDIRSSLIEEYIGKTAELNTEFVRLLQISSTQEKAAIGGGVIVAVIVGLSVLLAAGIWAITQLRFRNEAMKTLEDIALIVEQQNPLLASVNEPLHPNHQISSDENGAAESESDHDADKDSDSLNS